MLSSPAHVRSQNPPELMRDPVSNPLRTLGDIGIGFLKQRAPKLSSTTYINQFHVQNQFVVVLNYFSGDNGADEQLLAYCARVKVCAAAVLNCAVSQNPNS